MRIPDASDASRGRSFRAFAILLFVLAACGAGAAEDGRTFYVDFASGADTASGRSADQPWKHAPGDPNATAKPSSTMLRPGDTVRFRGGVIYRGSIVVAYDGAPGRPITYSGEGFGHGKAVISGREAFNVPLRGCAGEPACSGLPNAPQLQVAQMPAEVAVSDQLILNGRSLQLAQGPAPTDSFWFDNLKHFVAVPANDLAAAPDGETWRMRSPFLREALGARPAHDLVLHIWRVPNAISSLPVDSYDPQNGTITFRAKKLTPYPKQSLVALANHPALISGPDQFATIDGGKQIIVHAPPSNSATLEISRRKNAFDASARRHVVIEGFEIVGLAAGPTDWNGGTALLISPKGGADIAFRRNRVQDLTSWAGSAAVSANNVKGLDVTDNEFLNIQRGGGVGLGGGSSDVMIRRNVMRRIGRTGVAVLGAQRVWIDRNRISELQSVHANGIAVYLDNRDVLVSNNLVFDTPRALTFQGGPDADRLEIRNNLLRGSGRDGSAIQSWGRTARGVTISGNVLSVDGGAHALRLNGGDLGLIVQNNLIHGLLIFGTGALDWTISNNIYTAETYGGRNGTAAPFDKDNKFQGSLGKAGDIMFDDRRGNAEEKLCSALLSGPAPLPTWLPRADGEPPLAGVGPDGQCSG
jgi:hypothetical protein